MLLGVTSATNMVGLGRISEHLCWQPFVMCLSNHFYFLPLLLKPSLIWLQEAGVVTLRVMSKPGRITMAGHIMTIVRNILGEEASAGVGKIRMLRENGEEVWAALNKHLPAFCVCHIPRCNVVAPLDPFS